MFIHQPYGAFDLTGTDTGKFTPTVLPSTGNQLVNSPTPVASSDGLPLDVFVVASKNPQVIMREYARITGLPEMPARWTLGYQQSHRTLAGPDAIMGVARTLREQKLPCDTLIYLGTEFTPSGWNTKNGEFTWHPTNFPEPKRMLDELHAEHFKVVLHIVIEGRRPMGTVNDPCTAAPQPSGRTPDDQWPPDRQVSCYWPIHKTLMDVGVDGWWPDQGDGYDGPTLPSSSHVLGRHAALSVERASVRAPSQCVAGHSALRWVHLVGRRAVTMGDAQAACRHRHQ